MPKLDIKSRIVLYIVSIFLVAFVFAGYALYRIPRLAQSEIDNDLSMLATNIVERTNSADTIDIADLEWHTDSFQTAGSFYVVHDTQGNIVKSSINFPKNAIALAPSLLPLSPDSTSQSEPVFTTLSLEGQLVRVLHYPIVFELGNSDSTSLSGYLQVGRLTEEYSSYRQNLYAATLTAAAALFAAICALTLLVPHLFKPLDDIIAKVQDFNTVDDLSVRLDIDSISRREDEFRTLSISFNEFIMKMESLFKAQQRLLADVSHELRTPLTSVQGNVDLMRRMGSADVESLDAIESEAERMSRLVNDLLSLARADVGGLPIQRELVNLDVVFLKAFEQISSLDLSVRVILTDVEQVEVIGDEDRLRQLLLNLMSNAVKYTNSGGNVKVNLAADNNEAIITIEDTGIGISAEDLPNIFERFYRVNKARSRERGGTGLGLAISKSIVDAHRGTIKVTSEVGVGSKFTVRLPAYNRY